ncbi:MAG TPA: hypothetical protein VG889_07960 [Rhizomicrobium sp.]|nr:hypothetical protein [Rhizomicrobium sp.]
MVPGPKDFSDVATLVTLILGVPAGAFALYQYWDARRWKTAEFVAQEMKAFSSGPKCAAACKMLDWIDGNAVLPADGGTEKFEFKRQTVLRGLRTNRDIVFSEDEEKIRDVFDAFFGTLDAIDTYVAGRTRLFKPALLKSHLAYYLRIINADNHFGLVLRDFVETFGYDGVPHLTKAVTLEQWRGGTQSKRPASAPASAPSA